MSWWPKRIRPVLGFGLGLMGVVQMGCSQAPHPRSLHVVDGQVVSSTPLGSWAYATYTRARVAMEAEPPRLDEAREQLTRLLEVDRDDPHLWTTLGELEMMAGDEAQARAALVRALALEPRYDAALDLQARLTPESQ